MLAAAEKLHAGLCRSAGFDCHIKLDGSAVYMFNGDAVICDFKEINSGFAAAVSFDLPHGLLNEVPVLKV